MVQGRRVGLPGSGGVRVMRMLVVSWGMHLAVRTFLLEPLEGEIVVVVMPASGRGRKMVWFRGRAVERVTPQ